MPTIPLFDPQNNQSLQSTGSIAPATANLATSTANLFLTEGRALAEKIEVQSSKAEAQMKAPIIATAYADGLSKISQGDFSGFSRMEQANGMTAGNPLLMKFAEGARSEATQIARNFLDDRLSQRRIDADKSLHESDMAARIGMNNADNATRIQIAKDTEDKAAEAQYQTAYRQAVAQRNKITQEDIESEKADKLMRQQHPDTTATPFVKRDLPPLPTRDQFGINSGNSGVNFNQNDIPLPTNPDQPAVNTGTESLIPTQPSATNVPTIFQKDRSLIAPVGAAPKQAASPIESNPAVISNPNRKQALLQNFEQVPYGAGVTAWIAKLDDTSFDTKTETYKVGDVTYHFSSKAHGDSMIETAKKEAANVRAATALPTDFKNWHGKMMELGYTDFKSQEVSKDHWTYSASNGVQTQYFTDGAVVKTPDGKGTVPIPPWNQNGTKLTIDSKEKAIFDKAEGSTTYLLKNNLMKVDVPKDPTRLDGAALANFDKTSREKFANGSEDIKKEANALRADQGLTQLTAKDIKKPESSNSILVNDQEARVAEIKKQFGHNPAATSLLQDIISTGKDAVKDAIETWSDSRRAAAISDIKKIIDTNKKNLASLDKSEVTQVNIAANNIDFWQEKLKKLQAGSK